MSDLIISNNSPFDSIRREDADGEYWSARDLMPLLEYIKWQKFSTVVEIAKENVGSADAKVSDHFLPVEVKSLGRKALDYRLSRLAAYHVVLCCDSRGKESVKLAKHYFAVKTREAETAQEQEVIEIHQPVERVLPVRDAFDYANALDTINRQPDSIAKKLIRDLLVDELSLAQTLKYLPVAEKPKQYTIAKIRAKALGYSESQISNGSGLGRFVKSRVEPAFLEKVGIYDNVAHYEITPVLDAAIRDYFER